jgi:hypothetical protein
MLPRFTCPSTRAHWSLWIAWPCPVTVLPRWVLCLASITLDLGSVIMFDSCVVCVNIPPLIKGGIWELACVCVVSGAAVLLGA